ncbi:unnamed protein product [Gongylonema pulchrum]|uniref:Uncharacterized protein n=1 Tax=Gongylonema pulchrum TaxID=637853 RepID=A0A183D0A2_9BILA|nr:unnamed protein product [Gongylonema pulchrum]
MLNTEQQYEEHGLYLELVGMSKQLNQASSSRNHNLCHRFKVMLRKLVRYGSRYCGEVAKCVCMDINVQAGVLQCNAACDNLFKDITNIKPRRYTASGVHRLSFSSTATVFIFLRLFCLVCGTTCQTRLL